jgi:hypothetical protein
MPRSLHLVSNDVCGFVHLLNPMVDVILDEWVWLLWVWH